MKSFITFITFALVIMSFNASALILNSGSSNNFDATGTIKYQDKVFVQVKNGTGSSLAAGTLVGPDLTSDDGATVAKIVASAQASKAICMVAETIANGSMGKCQVYGYTDKLLFDAATTAVAGEGIFVGSSTAGYGLAIASASVSGYNTPVGIFLDASAASGSVEAYLNML